MDKIFIKVGKIFLSIAGVFALIISLGFITNTIMDAEQDYKDDNLCSTELSCNCRDKCADITGISAYDTWIYEKSRRDSQCHCITAEGSIKLW